MPALFVPVLVKLLLELSMECESLARAEALAAMEAIGGRSRVLAEEPGVMVVETKANPTALADRLGLCHFIDEWISTCAAEDIETCAEDMDVPGPIRVRSTKIGEQKVDLAGVSRRVGGIIGAKKGVDLHRPRSDIRIVFSTRAHAGVRVSTIERASFEKRKNRFLPFVYPASLHPKYARALINLTRASPGSKLLDPFCGTGAILAEASLAGMKAVGSDFDERMIEGARRNLAHVKAKADLHLCDVGDIEREVGKVDAIATDPPYGRSTSTDGEGVPVLYARAFSSFADVLSQGGRVAIVVPDLHLLDRATGFSLLEKHSLWVHRSLTRNFCVLQRD